MTDETPNFPHLKPNFKLWLEYDGQYALGPGAYALLRSIHSTGSISQAAKELQMSYRYAWGVIRKIESKLNAKLVNSYKGGQHGGGGATVTEYGLSLMDLYDRVNRKFIDFISTLE